MLLRNYQSITMNIRRDPIAFAKHVTYYFIGTSGSPVYAKLRRLSAEKFKVDKEVLDFR